MKKIYALFAAALMSASLFAAPEKIPAVADLAAKYDVTNNVVLCCYFDVAPCNPVVVAGNYNNWSEDPEKCVQFKELTDFDGWYVAEFTYTEGAEAKPLQLNNGSFDGWDFQAGDPAAWINLGGEGAKEAIVDNGGYDGEATVKYPSAGAYIYEIAYWKNHNNPCVEIAKHQYTIYFLAPVCDKYEDLFEPAVAGAFNGWAPEALAMADYEGKDAYSIIVESAEGKEFKFCEKNFGFANEYEKLNPEDNSWNTLPNSKFPVATKDTTLVFDYSDNNNYRYKLCASDIYDVTVIVKVPENAPEAGVELMGENFVGASWDNGIIMTFADTAYIATVKAVEGSLCKFREVGTWDNQIQELGEDENGLPTWKDMDNIQFGEYWDKDEVAGTVVLDLDFSDPSLYKWKLADEEGIENIVLTEAAQKVVVDGMLYIVRDNKMYNVLGTQVR